MIITLKREGTCAECGATLAVGTRARWYRNGTTYGLDCHEQKSRAAAPKRQRRYGGDRYDREEPLGQTLSRYDRYGVYAPDGTKLGSSCNCEDYPCCGH